MDDLTLHRNLDRRGNTLPFHHEFDAAPGHAAHLIDRVIQGQPLHGLPVDRGDEVPGLHPGAEGGRIVDRTDNPNDAVLTLHLETQAAELPGRLDLHVLERLGIHVTAVRIEAGQHAVDGILDQLPVIHRLHIFVLDAVEHVTEQRK